MFLVVFSKDAMTPGRTYQLGVFRLNADGRVLLREGRRVPLTPKAVDLLVALVEAGGEPVTKEDLLRRVWAGTVVEEGSLTSHVSLLRKALAEGGGEGFIETLSRRGYRFVGPIAAVSAAATAGTSHPAPSRTVTFLLAAPEAGTASPDSGLAAPPLHEAWLREAVARHGGQSLRVVEDAFCAAFPDAAAAVRAAAEAQRAVRAQRAGDADLPVRMGLHSGAVEDAEGGDLDGPTLVRATRVMAAAHGGQILLTAATVALLDRAAPPDGELRDLGDHTLRGFARPERIYQLEVAGLRTEFPPIRTQEAMRTNLPPPLTAFVGRRQALAEVGELVRRSRLVTLVGAGGTGKTRLSQEAARRLAGDFPDGVWLVELAPIADAALVPRAIAATLGARAEGDTPPLTLVENKLLDQRALLLLDNCEHVIEAAATVAHALVRALPRLHVLATSREPLRVEGESSYRVPSLTMPGAHASPVPPDVIASEAGQLFVDRAVAVQPAFALTERNAAAVAQVCRRLDGIPLAIELAAARLTALSVEEIASRLEDRFRLLTGGLRTALPRQRTLRALVDWSYDLLAPGERAVLDTLSVFAGGFTLEAAEAVAADDAGGRAGVLEILETLVAKSLVIAEMHDGIGTRYRLLETIRQYAGEKLAGRGQAEAVRRRHFDHFLGFAETGALGVRGAMALEWLDRLESEHDNLRAALEGAVEADPRGYARLAGSLRRFWEFRCHYTEAWTRLELACQVHAEPDAVRLEALIGAGLAAFRLAYAQRSDERLTEAIALARSLGHLKGQAEATLHLGHARRQQGPDAAEPILREALALAEAAGDRRCEALVRVELARTLQERGHHAEAQRVFLEMARYFEDAGCVIEAPSCLLFAGRCALLLMDFEGARRLLDDALAQLRRFGQEHESADTLVELGQLALHERRLDEARALTTEGLRIFRGLHDPKCGARTAIYLSRVFQALGDGPAALPHAEAAATTYREMGFPLQSARALCALGCIHATMGQGDAARRALFTGLVAQQGADRDTHLPELLEAIAGLHPDAPESARLLGSAAALRERMSLPLLPSDRADREQRHEEVRARHAGTDFDHAFAAGRALTRDEAIRSALALQSRN
jgi:predicted ATPase/DNA-binding winged helix-turn-helix (wHTH) protein